MANPGDQREQRHGGDEEGQNLDPGLAAYAHSADQSMGYLETELQGQTEDYGDEPYGAYEHGGAMNADSDRYTPTYSPDQTRLPDETGQPGAGQWAAQPPGSQPLGAGEQAMPAEYAAWNPQAVSGHGASANPQQPTANEPRARQTAETARVPRASSGGQREMRESGDTGGDTGQANPVPPPQVDTDAPTTEQANREHGAPLGTVPGTGHNADGGGDEEAGASAGGAGRTSSNQAVVGEGQPEAASRRVPITGETAEQGQAQPPRIEPAPPGGKAAAEQVLRRDTQEMQRQEHARAQTQAGAGTVSDGASGAGGQPSGRGQPVGTMRPTDMHAEAMLDARTRVHDAIDQLASEIPYGEEFAQQAKETADTALDRMEAQALEREAELQRDPTATP